MVALAEPMKLGPQPGPQTDYASCPADIAIYGGSAGGGKTYALLLDGGRGIGHRSWKPVIFRRTCPQITAANGLWDKACEIYPRLGATMRQSTLEAMWPSGAVVKFAHMQHEMDMLQWQGTEIPLIAFDEVTHFTEKQFWYLVSRSRSMGPIRPYIRATCNPDPSSWVLKLIEWWIDPILGTAIPERAGIVRWFVRDKDDQLVWGDTRAELLPLDLGRPLSITFIPAKLTDNPALMSNDPHYADKLRALPRAEREALLGGNWLSQASGVFDRDWWKTYTALPGGNIQCLIGGDVLNIPTTALRRFAIIDTAGTSKERAEEARGKEPSWSVCSVWDYYRPRHLLLARNVLRIRAEWPELKQRMGDFLQWNRVPTALIENAHFGPALAKEIQGRKVKLIGPKISGMAENHRGAKLERAVAAGAISRVEDGLVLLPDDDPPWVRPFLVEHNAWQGRPNETADQIDNTSYACYWSKQLQSAQWGGTINGKHGKK